MGIVDETAYGKTGLAAVARDETGTELQAAEVRPETIQPQAAELAKQFPEAQVSVEPTAKVAEERVSSPMVAAKVPEVLPTAEDFPTSTKSPAEETGVLDQVEGLATGENGHYVVIPPDEISLAEGDTEAVIQGPFKSRDAAQRFIDAEVGASNVGIAEVRNGTVVDNPFAKHITPSSPLEERMKQVFEGKPAEQTQLQGDEVATAENIERYEAQERRGKAILAKNEMRRADDQLEASKRREAKELSSASAEARKGNVPLSREAKEPWQMSRADFGKQVKATRHFQKYTPEQRANLAASHRAGHQQKQSVGERFYTTDLVPGRAFDSAVQAKDAAHRAAIETALTEGKPVPAEVLTDYPDLQVQGTETTLPQKAEVSQTSPVHPSARQLRRQRNVATGKKGQFKKGVVEEPVDKPRSFGDRAKDLWGDQWYVSNVPVKKLEEIGSRRVKRSAYAKAQREWEATPEGKAYQAYLETRREPVKPVAKPAPAEKVSAKTGFTNTQRDVLAGRIREVRDELPEKKGEEAEVIQVPNDGEFTLFTQTGADRLHRQLTGKTVPEFETAKTAPPKESAYKPKVGDDVFVTTDKFTIPTRGKVSVVKGGRAGVEVGDDTDIHPFTKLQSVESVRERMKTDALGGDLESLKSITNERDLRNSPLDRLRIEVAKEEIERRASLKMADTAPERQTDTPEFKRWFDNSKVVDERGKPLVVLHGTVGKEFAEFDDTKPARHRDLKKSNGLGLWFTRSPKVADLYSSGIYAQRDLDAPLQTPEGSRTLPVYLSMQSPARARSFYDLREEWDAKDGYELRTLLEKAGYDGAIFENEGISLTLREPAANYVVFKPEQIKSATGNRGTFSSKDPSILKTADVERSELRDEEDTALIPKVSSRTEGATVIVSPQVTELMRRLEGDKAASFSARFLSPPERRAMGRAFRQGAADMRAAGYSKEDADKLDQVARDLATAGRTPEGQRTVVIKIESAPESAQPHEELHRGSFLGAEDKALSGRHRPTRLTELAEHDAAKGWRELYKNTPQYQNISDALVVEETAATIAGGDYEKLGITADQSADFMLAWYLSYVERNGVQSLSQFKGTTNETKRIIEKVRANQSPAEAGRPADRGLQGISEESPPAQKSAKSGDEGVRDAEIKERGVSRSAREAGLGEVSEAQKWYQVRTNDPVAQKARDFVAENGVTNSINHLRAKVDQQGELGADETALGLEIAGGLAQQAESAPLDKKDAFLDAANDVLDILAPKATLAGQFIQFFSRMVRYSPLGAVRYAERQAAKSQQPLKKEERAEVFDSAVDLQTKEKLLARIEELRKQLEAKKSPQARGNARKELLDRLEKGEEGMLARLKGRSPALKMAVPLNDAFKRWFGKSKVVDDKGEPLVVYHGTNADFDLFDRNKIGRNHRGLSFGLHFTDSPAEAGIYAGPITRANEPLTVPVYLAIGNPLTISSGKDNPSKYIDLNRAEIIRTVVESRRSGKAYDGVIVIDDTGTKNYIAFESSQIKSSIGNRGTFDPNSRSILKMADPTQDDLTDYATLKLLRNLSKGKYTPEDLRTELESVAGKLSDVEFRQAAANAYAALKRTSQPISEDAKQSRENRKEFEKIFKVEKGLDPQTQIKNEIQTSDPLLKEAAELYTEKNIKSRQDFIREMRKRHPDMAIKEVRRLETEGFKLKTDAMRAVRLNKLEAKLSEGRDLTDEEKAELVSDYRDAKSKASKARYDLYSLLKQYEREHDASLKGAWKRFVNMQRGLIVSALQTTSNNIVSQTAVTVIRTFDDVFEKALVAAEKKSPTLARVTNRLFPNREGTMLQDTNWKDLTLPVAYLLKRNWDIIDGVLIENPAEYDKMYGQFQSDIRRGVQGRSHGALDTVLRGGEKGVDLVTTPMRLQEFWTRRAVFRGVLQQRLGARGQDLVQLIEHGQTDQIRPEDISAAVQAALETTFALKATTKGGQILQDVAQVVPPTLNPLTFARFMSNGMKFVFERNPTVLLKALGKKGLSPRDMAKGATGLVLWAVAYMAYGLLHDEDEPWYSWNGYDMRSQWPLNFYAFGVYSLDQAAKGKRQPDAEEFLHATTGLNTKFLGYNPGYRLGKSAVAWWNARDTEEEERASEFALRSGKTAAGSLLLPFTVPVKTVKDLYSLLDADEAIKRDVDAEPFLGQIKQNIPEWSQTLPPRMKEGKVQVERVPALKQFGINLAEDEGSETLRLAKSLRGEPFGASAIPDTTKMRLVAALKNRAMAGEDVTKDVEEAVRTKQISDKSASNITNARTQSALIQTFNQLDDEKQQEVLRNAATDPKVPVGDLLSMRTMYAQKVAREKDKGIDDARRKIDYELKPFSAAKKIKDTDGVLEASAVYKSLNPESQSDVAVRAAFAHKVKSIDRRFGLSPEERIAALELFPNMHLKRVPKKSAADIRRDERRRTRAERKVVRETGM